MSTRTVSFVLFQALVASMTLAVTSHVALGQGAGPPQQSSKEQREQMAALHEKMAACLRSDKDVAVCRDEMHKGCRELMGEQACPMMDMGMHDQMMKHGAADRPDGG